MIDDNIRQQIRAIQSEGEERNKAAKLPKWVKCMRCGGRPTNTDWLFDLMANGQGQESNVLIHESCLAKDGKFAGLNAGRSGLRGESA